MKKKQFKLERNTKNIITSDSEGFTVGSGRSTGRGGAALLLDGDYNKNKNCF